MKRVTKQLCLLISLLLVFSACIALSACAGGDDGNNGGNGNAGGGNNNVTVVPGPEWTEGAIAGFELPHTTGQANSDNFYDYNSELFYLNETRISGADPGALYVSYDDITDSYYKVMQNRQYKDEFGEYQWCDGWNEDKFIAEYGTLDEWKLEYGDYYYMIVTGGNTSGAYRIWRSHDLFDWVVCGRLNDGYAVKYNSDDWTAGYCSWAPEFVRDPETGLYFIWGSAGCKAGNETTAYSLNNTQTGYDYDGLTVFCAVSENPIGPYTMATAEQFVAFSAARNKDGKVKADYSKEVMAADLNLDGLGDAKIYPIESRDGKSTVGYIDKSGNYYNLNKHIIDNKTPVLNVAYYYPRLATNESKVQEFWNKYKIQNYLRLCDDPYKYRNSELKHCLWPAIDVNPVIGEDGTKYLYFSQHISSFNSGNNVWVVRMTDWLTPDWDTMTHVTTPKYVSVEDDGTFEGKLVGEPVMDEGSINEGTEVIQHNGKWYLTYSPFGYGSRHYSLYVAVSDSALGPFVKLGTTYSPIIGIGTEDNDYMAGTGHHCFIKAGDELWILYHCFYNPNDNSNASGAFLGRAIGADKAYWKYTEELGYDMMYGNGPTYNLQPKPETYTGYTNVGKYATIKGNGDFGDLSYLSDGMFTAQPFSRQYEYGKSDGKLEIHYKWDTPVEITALQIYTSGDAYYAFNKVNSVVFKLAQRPAWYQIKEYNGYCYIKDLPTDPNDFISNSLVMRKGSAAIAEFNPMLVSEMYLYFSGAEEDKYLYEYFESAGENPGVRVPEIYIFGNLVENN